MSWLISLTMVAGFANKNVTDVVDKWVKFTMPRCQLKYIYFLNLYWSTVDLQCSISFCSTAK